MILYFLLYNGIDVCDLFDDFFILGLGYSILVVCIEIFLRKRGILKLFIVIICWE